MKTKNDMLNVAICISGGGTTMREILRACKRTTGRDSDRLPYVNPALVISSDSEAGGISKAQEEGVSGNNIVIAARKEFAASEAYGDVILAACKKRSVDLVTMCGFKPKMPDNVVSAYPGMVLNQHPGPIDGKRPGFGGKGMHGRAVHHAVLHFATRCNRPFHTEATVHHAIGDVDKGNIIAISPVEIMLNDTAETLAARVLPYEHRLVISVLKYISEFRSPWGEFNRNRPLIWPGEETLLEEAKAAGRAAFPNG